MPINKMTARQVESTKKPGLYSDGGNLYLQVSPTGTKSWIFRFMLNQRPRKFGLGATHTVSLAEARSRAAVLRLQVHDGIDPIEVREKTRSAAKVEAAKVVTFRQCAESYIAANAGGWKNAKHAAQWTSTLDTYAFPVFGDLPVAAVDTGLVLRVLEPIWTTKAETASRVRGRIESVLDFAKVREHRTGENPARWKGHLQNALGRRSKVSKGNHHDAIPVNEIGAFMAELRDREGLSARALEFTILTAARTGEAIGATWEEIDLKTRLWTLPGSRMKAGRDHRVPLSDRAVAILESLPRDGGKFVFPGARIGRPLSNMAMLELVRGMRGQGSTVHGFRSTFRDWASERTNYPSDIAEAALAHIVRDKTEAAYRRGDLLEKRARMMVDWATYCEAPAVSGDNVVSLRVAQ